MEKPEPPGGTQSRSYRWVTAGFGLVFVGLAIAILLAADSQRKLGSAVAAAIVGGLGGDAIVSAVRGRRSLLSRLGPLP